MAILIGQSLIRTLRDPNITPCALKPAIDNSNRSRLSRDRPRFEPYMGRPIDWATWAQQTCRILHAIIASGYSPAEMALRTGRTQ